MNELATVSPSTASPFSGIAAFESSQRMAMALATSTLVPEAYRGNQNVGNILIALEISNRVGCSFMTVVQNLDVIHGKPGWSAKFLIGTVNTCGRFTPLRYEFTGQEGSDDWSCRAVASDKATGEVLKGTKVSIKMAKDEGWYGKTGSKWKTMPEQMLQYRAATFWVRLFSPELSLGMQTADELQDMPAPRPEIRTVTPTPVVAETPVTTVTVTPVAQEPDPTPVVAQDPAPAATSAPSIDALRAEVVAAFKRLSVSWPQVQAAAVAGDWWEGAATIEFKDLGIEPLEYMLKRADRIARRIKAVAEQPADPAAAAPAPTTPAPTTPAPTT